MLCYFIKQKYFEPLKEGTLRIQYELSEERAKELDELKKKCGISTKKDLITNALTLFEWAVKERESGLIIASVDEKSNNYKQIILPSIEAVKK